MERPIVGISMGDPFGNGPEITVKALNDPGGLQDLPTRWWWGIALHGICTRPCPRRSTAST